ncbi:tripartite tricarboxylate transporter substrate binding protein [Hydrogenophaga sp.]|uniref:Bug family tripartite tricarboxylate transporter substrate binding protein n=1 Tax=Hydrogenophaga sp. TaxID=1904254 RepID=UPI0025C6AAF1|nr:tripartite tricarboxylate transporter substrate binding protein [Hydrogenophaga sp.]MBT9466238.1 tripartite tricarboxylate transporter substrate binding protein [Hydrogenophaga sp.]
MAPELKCLWLTASLLTPIAASAAGCPAPACFTQPVEIVVPFAAGGQLDTAARIIAAPLSAQVGQKVNIKNLPGASGAIGVRQAVNAAPDSHTILVTSSVSMVVTPVLHSTPPFNPLKDLIPVIQIGSTPHILAVHSDSPWKSLKDFVAAASTGTKSIKYGSAGLGSFNHLLAERLKMSRRLGLLQHTPYRGNSPALNDLSHGQIDVMFVDAATATREAQSGRLRFLAITGDQRSPGFPDVQTFNEQGFAGMESAWIGVFYPANTHQNIVVRLKSEMQKLLTDPNVREKLEALGIEAGGLEGDAFARAMALQSEAWRGLIQGAGVRVR